MSIQLIGDRVPPGSAAPATDRAERAADVGVIEQIVINVLGIKAKTLRAPRRGPAPVAFARQVAMYMVHVQLGESLTAAGRHFGRDRTTAAHACRLVEDLRERPQVEQLIIAIEVAIERWLALSGREPPARSDDRVQ